TNSDMVEIDNPTNLPEQVKISKIEEPYIKTSIFVPTEYIGGVMELCENNVSELLTQIVS
ncbi:MAG: hypothetical protein IJ130_02960, partial [Solobacterium sp.]|nr:hypothetical protein [Solobacterium sp.]